MILDEKDLSQLILLISPKLDSDKTYDSQSLNYTTGSNSKIFSYIEKILRKYIPFENEKIHIAMILEATNPYHIHTDYVKDDDKPANAYLIPIDNCQSATVIFNEECKTTFKDFKTKNPNNNFMETVTNYKEILSHCKEEDLKYVSVKQYAKWQKGLLINWNRKLLHASDNFINNGIEKKLAIVIFTSYI